MACEELRIDDLARKAGITVDTVRYYQREGLLPPAERAGRAKLYGPDHLTRLERIRELQERRFSLAAIKALLESERTGLVEGIFGGEGSSSFSLSELVERSGASADLVERLHKVGLLRDPSDFGRDSYDANDVDVLRAVAELSRLSLPDDVLEHLVSIYVDGVEAMQLRVLALFGGAKGAGEGGNEGGEWEAEELARFQTNAARSAGELLPLVTRVVEYVHLRTLQRLTLGAIERETSPTK